MEHIIDALLRMGDPSTPADGGDHAAVEAQTTLPTGETFTVLTRPGGGMRLALSTAADHLDAAAAQALDERLLRLTADTRMTRWQIGFVTPENHAGLAFEPAAAARSDAAALERSLTALREQLVAMLGADAQGQENAPTESFGGEATWTRV